MDLCAIGQDQFIDRLKQMYPMVDMKETPLPTCWSQKDKFQDVGLTQNNLRAHYKGKFFVLIFSLFLYKIVANFVIDCENHCDNVFLFVSMTVALFC